MSLDQSKRRTTPDFNELAAFTRTRLDKKTPASEGGDGLVMAARVEARAIEGRSRVCPRAA